MLTELKTCRHCRRIFQYIGFGEELCPACKKASEEKFAEVKHYLNTHPKSQFRDLIKEVKVTERQVTAWIREGRLQVPDTFDVELRCAKCGAPVTKGTLCEDCKKDLAGRLAEVEAVMEKQKQADQLEDKRGMQFIREKK